MNQEQIGTMSRDLIYLLNCALHNRKPEDMRVKKMHLKNLHMLAKYHSIEVITYMALEKCEALNKENEIPEKVRNLLDSWKKEKEQSVRKHVLFDIERERIAQFMESKGIWYMPLKGVLLKNIYPAPEMRQMTDNDILFDKSYRQDIYEFMVENAYEAIEFNESNHDEYLKKPVYNFEMHVDLFGKGHDIKWQEYYKNVKERLIKDENNSYGYHFGNEDFYVYNIIHAYNHYIRRGTGFRTVIDFYLFVDTYGSTMNWEYVESQLKKLGVYDFEKEIRSLSMKIFKEELDLGELTQEEVEMFNYILFAGTFGTEENHVKYKVKAMQTDGQQKDSKTRFKYLWSRIFPGMAFFKKYYPVVYKHKWLLPFAYIYRIFKALFVKRDKAFGELNTVMEKEK